MKGTFKGIISLYHTTFVPERQILYGVVVINEIVDMKKKDMLDCLLLNVDFEPTYYCVIGSFLEICCINWISETNGEGGWRPLFSIEVCMCLL